MKLEFEYVPIDSLTPYEKNARKHGDFDVAIIKKSIQEFGFNDPIGVWSDKNIVVEGHGRLMAAKELGMTEVPIIRLDHLTDEQRRLYALEHNRSAEMSTWDLDALLEELNDFKGFDLESLGFAEFLDNDLEEDGEVVDDDFEPIVPFEATSKTGDIYVLGHHRLMCGDSTDYDSVVKLLDGAQVDLLYTDPPYNVNVSNSEGMTIENDNLPEDVFLPILQKAFENASKVIKDGGAFYVWHPDTGRVNFQISLEEQGFMVKQCLIWVKNGFNFGRQDYKWQHEPCLYGWKEGAGHYFIPEYNHSTVIEQPLDIDSMKKDQLVELCHKLVDAIYPSTVIHENKPIKNDLHPTMKPIVICGEMIRNSSRGGWNENVLDLFGGSGSTMIACEQLKRNCYMMELDPAYVDVIVKRYLKYMGTEDGCYLIRDGERFDIPQEFISLLD